ncbi:MAG: hypothetical protein D3926_23110 [Desulfobacteraceae bacterium]|nr:MAG: hypothetical protein D3926_23110 [Desulfobacteraceae bacterium]
MKAYQCGKCGTISGSESGVCKAAPEVKPFYICDDCSQRGVSPESLCRPLKMHPKYYCKQCGVPAVTKDSLCKPKGIFSKPA